MTTVNLPFIDKYKPKTLQQIQGQSLALQELRTAVVSKKPALLYGPVGSGKTASVYALANDLGYEIIEINASDVRNKDAINSIIGSFLQQICQQEKIQASEDVLKKIARKANGDLRSAILDLESLGRGTLTIAADDVALLDDRLREQSMTDALRLVFKSTKPQETLQAFERVDADLSEVQLWVEENLPREYTGQDLYQGSTSLSKADVFNGRILRWQHWRFLVYINTLLTAGISLAKQEKTPGFVEYKRNSRILRYWMAKQKRLKLQGILQQLPGTMHGSSRQLMKEVLPYVRFMARKNKQFSFGLEKEDLLYLVK